MNRSCAFCGKGVGDEHCNYCSWECHVGEARAAGGTAIAPNGLPIRCITADNTMMEHEHADHPDYKFPVTVEYCGSKEDEPCFVGYDGNKCSDEGLNQSLRSQEHALIYTDGYIAVTLYEHVYAMWNLRAGEVTAGHMWKKSDWRLSEASVEKIIGGVK